MKRFLALLCALTLALSLAACRSTGKNAGTANGGTAGNGLADDVERGLEDAKDGLERAGDDLEDDLDRMIEDGDLTDDPNR